MIHRHHKCPKALAFLCLYRHIFLRFVQLENSKLNETEKDNVGGITSRFSMKLKTEPFLNYKKLMGILLLRVGIHQSTFLSGNLCVNRESLDFCICSNVFSSGSRLKAPRNHRNPREFVLRLLKSR